MKDRSFQGKVAAITGAASGIGRALAVALARRGCALALADLDAAGLAETVAMLHGVQISSRTLDVADEAAVRTWAGEVVRDHGRVNLVFNNAGIGYAATVQGASTADLRRVIDVDFWGVVHGTRAFLPHLEASGDGHVVNVSSLFGLLSFPGQSAYNAAKFAVRGFTESLQLELELTGVPVRATSVHPGGVRTNIARASKTDPSLAALGVDVEEVGRRFERSFRLTAGEAADIILRGVQRNDRRVLVGTDAKLLDLVQRLAPGRYQVLVARAARRLLAKRSPAPQGTA